MKTNSENVVIPESVFKLSELLEKSWIGSNLKKIWCKLASNPSFGANRGEN